MRWGHSAVLAVCCGLFLGTAVIPAAPAAADCVAGVACPPVAPPPSVSGQAPAVQLLASRVTGRTSALISGTVNPEGLATIYHWTYADTAHRAPAGQSATFELVAEDRVEHVSTQLTNLVPGVHYRLTLVATNGAGTTSRASSGKTTGAFTTPCAGTRRRGPRRSLREAPRHGSPGCPSHG